MPIILISNKSINLPRNQSVANFIEDPSLFVLIWCVLEILFGVLAVFGNTLSNKVSAFLFSITTIIYFNPLLPENRLNLYDMRIELFYNIGIFLAILLCSYQPIPDDAVEESPDDEIRFIIDRTKSASSKVVDQGTKKAKAQKIKKK